MCSRTRGHVLDARQAELSTKGAENSRVYDGSVAREPPGRPIIHIIWPSALGLRVRGAQAWVANSRLSGRVVTARLDL